MSDDRRPTWLELARLEQGVLEPETAERVRARLAAHGPPEGAAITTKRLLAEQPAELFLGQVRRRAAVIGRWRMLGVLAVGLAAAALLLAAWPRGEAERWSNHEPSPAGPNDAPPSPTTRARVAESTVAREPEPAPGHEPEPGGVDPLEPGAVQRPDTQRDVEGVQTKPVPVDGERGVEAPPSNEFSVEPGPPALMRPPPPDSGRQPRGGAAGSGLAGPSPSPNPADLQTVRLYATLDDLLQGRTTGTTRARVQARGLHARERTSSEPEMFWALDIDRKQARALGQVFAFEAGGATYVNEWTPRPGRGQRYGKLTRVGDRGVYIRRVCYQAWGLGSTIQCTPDLRVIDLGTGKGTSVGRAKLRRWLRAEPELRARFEAEPDQGMPTLRRYLVELLTKAPGAVKLR